MLAMALVVVACGTSDESPSASVAAPSASSIASSSVELGGSGAPSAEPAASASSEPSPFPSATPPVALVPGTADPAKFGFRAKGLSHEVMAFVTTAQLDLADRAAIVLEVQAQPAALHQDRLVLDDVTLERELLAGLDDEDLADVLVGERPDELVAPGLPDDAPGVAIRRGHAARTSFSPASTIASWVASEVASV